MNTETKQHTPIITPAIEQELRAWYGKTDCEPMLRACKSYPVMLAALEAIVKIMDGSQPKDYPGALMVAQSAIKLVKGETP